MTYKEIIKKAIDLHVHVGPEVIPRKFNVPDLLKNQKRKIRGIGIKNHFFPSVYAPKEVRAGEPFIINSIVLNWYMGGFNPKAVQSVAEISNKPIIVWFPTLHTEGFLASQTYEIPKEWLDESVRDSIILRKTRDITPLRVTDVKGNIRPEVLSVLETIKEYDAILATGHLSWQESRVLVKAAKELYGIERIIVTHPIYQKINMPIMVQKELANMGAYIEQCYSMYTIDNIEMKNIAKQIQEVGAENCIMSSDVGQSFSLDPDRALADFAERLEKEGVLKQDIKIMLVDNPAKLTD